MRSNIPGVCQRQNELQRPTRCQFRHPQVLVKSKSNRDSQALTLSPEHKTYLEPNFDYICFIDFFYLHTS